MRASLAFTIVSLLHFIHYPTAIAQQVSVPVAQPPPALPLEYYPKPQRPPPVDDAPSTIDYSQIVRQYYRGFGEIPSECPVDKPTRDEGLCYRDCPIGFEGHGPVCWQNCPGAYKNVGVTCYLSLAEWKKREWASRGLGELPNGCKQGYEKSSSDNDHLFLCYPQCRPRYKGVGPICFLVESP